MRPLAKHPLRPLVALLLAGLVGPAPLARAEEAAAAAAEPAASCADEVVARVQQRYEGVSDLTARFEQTTRVASLRPTTGEGSKSFGHVAFAKPGRMRWSYEKPNPSLVVSDGTVAWVYDPAAREAQKMPASEALLSGGAMQFLLGRGDLRRDFAVRAPSCDGETVSLELVPREPATYEKLEITAVRSTGDVRVTRVSDLVGNVTEVRFHDVHVNAGVAASEFEFNPPEGVRVIELQPVQP